MIQRVALFILALTLTACTTLNVADPSSLLASGGPSSSAPSSGDAHKLGGVFPQQAGDFWVNQTAVSPFAIKDTGGVTRDTIETAHGRITAGGGGSDVSVVVGPRSGSETTIGGLFLPANQTLQLTANANASELDLTGTTFAMGGSQWWLSAGNTCVAFNAAAGCSTTAPLRVDFGTATTPLLQSGTNATALTLGTNRAAGTLLFQVDAAVNVLQLAGGTQNGVAIGANLATVGHVRYPAGVNMLTRNSTNTGNNTVFSDDGGNNASIGSGYGTLTFNPGNFTVVASGTIILEGGSDFYEDMTTLHIRNASHVETTTILPLSASGAKITGGLAWTTRTITGNLTIDTTTTDNIVLVDTTSSAITVTLPTPTNGRWLTLIDKANTFATNNLTIARSGSEKINGTAASKVVSASGARTMLFSDGTDWYSLNVSGTKPSAIPGLVLLALALLRKRRAANDTDIEEQKRAA